MNETLAALDDLAFMSALLDLAIPPSESGDLPGAGALGLAPDVAKAVRADALLGPFVETGVEALRGAALAEHPEGLPGLPPETGTKVIEAQLTGHPMLMLGLLRHTCPAYYQHPQALEAIGEPPRPPFPEGFEVQPTDADLLKELQTRKRS